MSDQQITKTLGQVGYEAMLAVMRERDEEAGRQWTDDPELRALAGAWENQPPILREDWEAVATAIAKEASELLYQECKLLKAQLLTIAVQP